MWCPGMGARTLGDYPRNLTQFRRRFPGDEACLHYLVETRWPEGFRCPRCGSPDACLLGTRRLWQCRSCRHQTSATAGTILHRSRLPLTAWFTAAYLMASLKPGISALQLSQQLDIHYETAWLMLHKLRRAMVNPDRSKLTGEVEVDETWIGGKQAGLKGGRQRNDRKALLVAVAVERRAKQRTPGQPPPKHTHYLGRLRLEVVPDDRQETLSPFVERNVERRSTVISDAWWGYDGLAASDYTHLSFSQAAMKRAGVEPDAVPGVHRVVSNLGDLAAGHLPRGRSRPSRPLPGRVRLPLQPPLLSDGRVRHAARARRGTAADHHRRDSVAALRRRDQPAEGPLNGLDHRPFLGPGQSGCVARRSAGIA
jgi:transposase-like protein